MTVDLDQLSDDRKTTLGAAALLGLALLAAVVMLGEKDDPPVELFWQCGLAPANLGGVPIQELEPGAAELAQAAIKSEKRLIGWLEGRLEELRAFDPAERAEDHAPHLAKIESALEEMRERVNHAHFICQQFDHPPGYPPATGVATTSRT